MDETTSHVKTFRDMTLDEKVAYTLKHAMDDYIPSWYDIDARYAQLRECKDELYAFIKEKVIYKIAKDILYLNEKGMILISEGLDRCALFTFKPEQLKFERIRMKYIKELQNKTYRTIMSNLSSNPEVMDRYDIANELSFCGDMYFSVDKEKLDSTNSKLKKEMEIYDSIPFGIDRLWYAFLPSFIKK